MCSSRFLIPTLVAALLAGCSFQEASPGERSRVAAQPVASTFTAGLTTLATPPAEAAASDAWGIPTRRDFPFRSCLVDSATLTPLRGVEVQITGGSGPRTLSTDPGGCVQWTENIEYNHLAPEHRLDWPRSLVVRGQTYPLKLAVNPWRRGADALVDFTHTAAPAGLVTGGDVELARLGRGRFAPRHALGTQPSNLLVTQMRVRRREVRVGAAGPVNRYEITFTLQSQRLALDAVSWEREALSAGRFRVSLSVWEQEGERRLAPISAVVAAGAASLASGLLELSTEIELTDTLAETSTAHLKFVVTPEGEGASLLAAEGWYHLRRGSADDQGTPAVTAPAGVIGASSSPRPAPGVTIQTFSVEPFHVGPGREWTMPVDLRARVCLATAEENRVIAAISTRQFHFELSADPAPDAKSAVAADELQGNCFIVRKSNGVTYEPAQGESYRRLYLHVHGQAAPYQRVVVTRPFGLNPWQHERASRFFVDLGANGAVLPTLPVAARQSAELSLDSVTYEFLGKTARVSAFLQNAGIRHYRLTMRPKLVAPYRSHVGRSVTEPLFLGARFLVHGVFSTPRRGGAEPTEADYLGEFVTESTMEDNAETSVNVALPVDFADGARLRSAVVLTLRMLPLPLTAPHRPRTLTYRFSFDPLVDRPSGNSRTESSFLRRGLPQTEFVALIPRGAAPAAVVDGNEIAWARSAAVRRWDLDGGLTAFGLQPTLVGEPIQWYSRFLADSFPLRKVHLDDDRTAAGWLRWTGGARPTPATDDAVLDTLDRGALSTLLTNAARAPGARTLSGTIANVFCRRYLATRDAEKTQCEAEPGRFLDATLVTIADRVVSQPERRVPDGRPVTDRIRIQASFFKEVGYQDRATTGDRGARTATLGIMGKFGLENLGTGGGPFGSLSWTSESYASTEVGVVDAVRVRRTIQEEAELVVRTWPIALELVVHSCLVVRPQAEAAGATGNEMGYLLCARVSGIERTENWYEVLDPAPGVATVQGDLTDPRDRGWTRLLRGEPALARLRQRLADSTQGAVFHRVEPWTQTLNANVGPSADALVQGTRFTNFEGAGVSEVAMRDGGLFPGVFEVRPVLSSFRNGWTEAVLAEKTHILFNGMVAGAMQRGDIPSRREPIGTAGAMVDVPDVDAPATQGATLKWLRRARAMSRCFIAEHARRCSVALFERDRMLCFVRDITGARPALRVESDGERTRLSRACSTLAQGAFP